MKTRKPVLIKKGALSKAEKEFISTNIGLLTDEQIATKLRRALSQVEAYRQSLVEKDAGAILAEKERNKYLAELRTHPRYEYFKKQFSRAELVTFEAEFVGLMSQFKEATYTEKDQMFTYITISIYLLRLGIERMQTIQDIDRIAAAIKAEYDKGKEYIEKRQDMILQMETQLASLRNASTVKTKEYSEMDSRKASIMKDLKGTRDQRIKKMEDSRVNFIGLMRAMDDEDLRREMGTEMLLQEAAVDAEKARLGALHEFKNGEVDRPILSYETVGDT